MTITETIAPSGWPEGAIYHSSRGLYDFQLSDIAQALVMRTEGRPYGMVVWDTGLGKAEPLSEPVLTPTGWSVMGNLRMGDQVISADGRPATVLAVHPQESREVYRVTFSDGSWTRCSPEHLWTVSYWGSGRSSGKQTRVRRTKTVSLRQLMSDGITTPKGRRKFAIPMTAPVQYSEQELPMEPYALGVILGDGSVNDRGYVSLTTDKEIIDALAVDGVEHDHVSPGVARLNTGTWSKALRGLGLAGHRAWEKFVPEIYLRAPEADRRALLAGLLDTDGSPIDEGGAEFSTTSETLLDAVIELAESLGGQARNKSSRFTTYTHDGESKQGRESWRVNIKLSGQPFRLARKMVRWVEPTKYPVQRMIDSIERDEDEQSVCITIDRPDGLYLTRHHVVTHNSHFAMATAAFTVQDGGADLVIMVCERVKLKEWEEDFKIFTRLSSRIHHGPSRKGKITKLGLPDVLISTYETYKADLAQFEAAKRGKKIVNGWLMDQILASGRKPMVVFDESDKLSNRTSASYKAWTHVLKTLRGAFPDLPTYMMTATPIRRDLENGFNQLRLLAPDRVPLVKEFEEYFVRGRDIYGKARYHDHRIPDFVELIRPLLMVKSKEDPDVRDQFPALTEEALWVDMEGGQDDLYSMVHGLDTAHSMMALRQICAHPASIIHSAKYGTSKLARMLVDELGEAYLRSLPSAKTERLVEYLKPVVLGQGAKAVVFSFFGPSVLPLLKEALEAVRIPVWTHNEENGIEAFKRSSRPGVLLASDAAARGVNLPEASYLVEYDLATTYGTRTQRLNRASRIGSGGPTLTVRSMLARRSVEISLMHGMLRGHQQSDSLLGRGVTGDEFLTAAMRRQILTEGMHG